MLLLLITLLVQSQALPCKVSVVGAGVGGLYSAFRLVNSSTYLPSEVCVFEATNRVGGRAYSVRGVTPMQNSIDIGAHGYKPNQHLIMHSLVNDVLGLNTACRSRNQRKDTCYDIGDSYFFLRNKYVGDLSTSNDVPYGLNKNEEWNKASGSDPDPILEAVITVYPFILDYYANLTSFDPTVRYPAIKATLARLRTTTVNGKYPNEYTMQTLLNHSSEYWSLYLDADGESISSVLLVNMYDVLREAVYYAMGDVPGSGGYVIVDANNKEIGYATISESLTSLLVAKGVSVQYNKRLVSLKNSVTLGFADGTTVTSEKVILNIPLNNLRSLSSDSVIFTPASTKLLDVFTPVCAIKGYFYYPTAWWQSYGDSSVSNNEINRYYEYKDNNIECTGSTCKGVVQVVYADGLDYCTPFWNGNNDNNPLLIVQKGSTDPIQSKLFNDLATAVSISQKSIFPKAADIPAPETLVLGAWKSGWHVIRPSSTYKGGDANRLMLNPVPGVPVYVVNEAYSVDQGWAEGSLIAAEKVLKTFFNLNRPTWLGNEYWYDAIVANNDI